MTTSLDARRHARTQRGAGPTPPSLRIAMVMPPWYPTPPHGYGGIESAVAALVDALVAHGHDVTVIGAGQECGTSGRFLSTLGSTQHARLGEALPATVHAARVEALLREHPFDVVHDHSPVGPLMAAHRTAPTVVTAHGPVDDQLGDLYESLGDAIALVAVSRSQRGARPRLPWIGTIHHGLDTGTMVPAATPDGPVLWLARFCREKGPELAIRACRAAGLPLVLAGKCHEAEERRYLDDVVRPMLGPDVELVLNGDRATTERLLRHARCLVMPLRWEEPFGMVAVEAMASGTPVVALRRGSMPELVRPGVNGLLCDSPDELPDALRRVSGLDPSAAVEDARVRFGADVAARRYEAVYRAVAARPGGGTASLVVRPG